MNYIKIFQKNNFLVPDGIIGIKTLLKMKEVFNLPSNEATAHFIGQIDHETAGFKFDKENLNYSSVGLRRVFSKYFPTIELAIKYARKPELIANRVYANRMGNGPETSGDGWKFSGKGSLQLTGKNNYTAFSSFVGDFGTVENPNTILPKHYWTVAIFFFEKNNLFSITNEVDYNSIRKLTKKINGGYNGLQHRYDMTIKYYKLLKKKVETETQQDEGQNIGNNNNSIDSDINTVLVPENSSEQEGVSSSTNSKEKSNSNGFFSKIIRWLLSKISS